MSLQINARKSISNKKKILRLLLEFSVSILAALTLVFLSRFVRSVADPLFQQDLRVGHVSALAAMQIPFFSIVAFALIFLIVAPRTSKYNEVLVAFAPAILAGLTTGYIAGSVNIALAGTNWPLFGNSGDSGVILEWSRNFLSGEPLPETYPPGYLFIISVISRVLDAPVEFSAKLAQIITTALIGPIAYIAWRLVAGPFFALALGVLAMLPLVTPYKPYPNLMLVVLIALVVRFVLDLRRVDDTNLKWAISRGLLIGGLVGVTSLIYSGWFIWSAVGILAVVIINFPWKKGKKTVLNSVWFLCSTLLSIVLVGGIHLIPMLRESLFGKAVSDTYFYSDTYVDPAFFIMAQGDLSDKVDWPPIGELGGVGIFMLVLAAAVAVAIAFSWKNPIVQVPLLIVASALAARYAIASLMVYTNAVYLWPRTQAVLIFALLVVVVFVIRYLWNLLRQIGTKFNSLTNVRAGIFLAFALVLSSAASSISSEYYPLDTGTTNKFAFYSQHMEHIQVGCFPLMILERCPPSE